MAPGDEASSGLPRTSSRAYLEHVRRAGGHQVVIALASRPCTRPPSSSAPVTARNRALQIARADVVAAQDQECEQVATATARATLSAESARRLPDATPAVTLHGQEADAQRPGEDQGGSCQQRSPGDPQPCGRRPVVPGRGSGSEHPEPSHRLPAGSAEWRPASVRESVGGSRQAGRATRADRTGRRRGRQQPAGDGSEGHVLRSAGKHASAPAAMRRSCDPEDSGEKPR